MKVCEYCGKEIDGSYGSGRFCSKSCAIAWSNKKRGSRSLETKMKIAKANSKPPQILKCKFCGKDILHINGKKHIYCSDECRKLMIHKIPTLIKHFGFDQSLIGTSNVFNEIDRISKMVEDLYWNQHKSSIELSKIFGFSDASNFSNQILQMLGIKQKTLNEAIKESYLMGRTNASSSNKYKHGYHTTWNNKEIFYRSSYELNLAKEFDKMNIDYDVECLRIEYYDTIKKTNRIAIPDFFLKDFNTIIEVKSTFTFDKQNMIDKMNAYIDNGYIALCYIDDYKMLTIEDIKIDE